MPLLVIAVLVFLMIQLQSFSRMLMVVLTAPLGLIGVVGALLLFHMPFGFVAMLGHDRDVRHHHAQLRDPGRSDRAGHPHRA